MKQALRDALDARGYEKLTPVQEAVLNPDLEGRDLLVSAQTGSGKTVGFGLSIAPTLLGDADVFDAAHAPLALVIAPTRELALQVKRELQWLYANAGAHLASCVGGMDMRDERRALARGAHIVVATPGRLRDHISRGSIDLSQLRAVVLDEADEMLDLGFREDLEFILGEAPEERQTLLFSATVPQSITQLAKNYQRDAERVITKSEAGQHADIEYRAMQVAERDADNAVINTLRYYEAPNAIVFGNTRAMVNRLTTRLSNRGFQVVSLSGELSQAERTHALQAMRDGRAQVCVATDVAARGIDLPNLDLVVHAELPSNHETLLHRSGRTGRAGRKGVSALIVTKKSQKKAQRILNWAKLKAEWGGAPSAEEVMARDEERMLADPVWTEAMSDTQAATVEKLVEQFTPTQIAAAYLKLYRDAHTAPEEISHVDTKPVARKDFGSSQWFSLAGGREAGADPRRLLPMLCKSGDLTKDDIGAIRIQQNETFFQIRDASVAGFVATLGEAMKVEGSDVKKLDEAPVLDRGPRPGGKGPGGGRGPGGARGPGGKSYGGNGPAKPHRGKPRPEYDDKPRAKSFPKPEKSEKPVRAAAPSAAPIDWNDDPAPRAKKPKGGDAAKGQKPRNKSAGPARSNDGGHGPAKRRSDGDKPPFKARTSGKPGDKPKGPPPPKGKSNSKKNKARAAAAKGAKKKGGAH